MPTVPTKLEAYAVSIFTEMSALALEHGAINLSQGYPDFQGPAFIVEAAVEALRSGLNQYAPSHGIPALRQAVASKVGRFYGLRPDPEDEVTVFSGATEAIFSTVQGLCQPGDQVLAFEPYYDSYAASAIMAGASFQAVPLTRDFSLDMEALERRSTRRTRLLILNTPMNPTGKVFSEAELSALARFCVERDITVVSDEVYEHLVYGDSVHVPIAMLPGMWERTVTISSTAKTFSLTGWKIGYAVAHRDLSIAIRMAHQYVTFCTPPALQQAMALAIERSDDYYPVLRAEYQERRDLLMTLLHAAGLRVIPPDGTYFMMADFRELGFHDDREFCRFITTELGVAAIPPSAFYQSPGAGRHLARFAFCKDLSTLEKAGERLSRLRSRAPAGPFRMGTFQPSSS